MPLIKMMTSLENKNKMLPESDNELRGDYAEEKTVVGKTVVKLIKSFSMHFVRMEMYSSAAIPELFWKEIIKLDYSN